MQILNELRFEGLHAGQPCATGWQHSCQEMSCADYVNTCRRATQQIVHVSVDVYAWCAASPGQLQHAGSHPHLASVPAAIATTKGW
jgi:hypothetical protein